MLHLHTDVRYNTLSYQSTIEFAVSIAQIMNVLHETYIQ
jgi:hypothetical protein